MAAGACGSMAGRQVYLDQGKMHAVQMRKWNMSLNDVSGDLYSEYPDFDGRLCL